MDFYAQATDPFGPPMPITELNTSSREQDPWLTPDLRYIMFSSDSGGRMDIYEASR